MTMLQKLIGGSVQALREGGVLCLMAWYLSLAREYLTVKHRTYFIYENTLDGPRFPAKVEDVVVRVLTIEEEFDRLEHECLCWTRWDMAHIRAKAANGAIPFCCLVGGCLAHVTWVALSQGAKNDVDAFLLPVNWKAEAWSGNSRTAEEYQGLGLFAHTYSHIFSFLAGRGLWRDRFTIERNNAASNHTMLKMGSRVTGLGSYLRILVWERWGHKPVPQVLSRSELPK